MEFRKIQHDAIQNFKQNSFTWVRIRTGAPLFQVNNVNDPLRYPRLPSKISQFLIVFTFQTDFLPAGRLVTFLTDLKALYMSKMASDQRATLLKFVPLRFFDAYFTESITQFNSYRIILAQQKQHPGS